MNNKDHIELSKKLIQALRYSRNDDENAAALSRTVRAAIAYAYEDAANIASGVGEKWDARGDGLNALPACEEAANLIRAKAERITNT